MRGDPTVGTYREAIQKEGAHAGGLGWDFRAATPLIRYSQGGAEHIVWMDNRASLAEKIGVAKQMGFAGISVWRLGFEDPGFWDLWPSHWPSSRRACPPRVRGRAPRPRPGRRPVSPGS